MLHKLTAGQIRGLALLLAAFLACAWVLSTASDVLAKPKKPKNNQSRARFVEGYKPPEHFTCKYVEKEKNKVVEAYMCKSGKAKPVRLGAILAEETEMRLPPDDSGWEYLAAPDQFQCKWEGGVSRETDTFRCEYEHRHEDGQKHSYKYRLSETTLSDPEDGSGAAWYPAHSNE
ncbi:hypothetical protein ACFQ7F_16250 [Streptomyces sp. NPDC056486]|uniref:hypothetical protein n=1 Tax=Streptomyces sp. NPDC056486 TaxID=3345835 RepID=UPI0036BB9FE4